MAAAFNAQTMTHLGNSIRQLYQRRRMVGKLVLSQEEYLETFVPIDVRPLFRDVSPWIATEKYHHKFTLALPSGLALNAQLRLSEAGGTAPVPRSLFIQSDAPK